MTIRFETAVTAPATYIPSWAFRPAIPTSFAHDRIDKKSTHNTRVYTAFDSVALMNQADTQIYPKLHWFCCKIIQQTNCDVIHVLSMLSIRLWHFTIAAFQEAHIVQHHSQLIVCSRLLTATDCMQWWTSCMLAPLFQHAGCFPYGYQLMFTKLGRWRKTTQCPLATLYSKPPANKQTKETEVCKWILFLMQLEWSVVFTNSVC